MWICPEDIFFTALFIVKRKRSRTPTTANKQFHTDDAQAVSISSRDCWLVVPPFIFIAARSLHFETGPRKNPSEIDRDVLSNLMKDKFKSLSGKIVLCERRETGF